MSLGIFDKIKGRKIIAPIKIAVVCAGIILFIFLPALIIGKGRLFMNADFNAQQIPFNILCNKTIKNGEYFWSWQTDLGSNFISSYSFYTIGSPFFWLLMLVPSEFVVYALGPILILKFAVAGFSSFLYLSQYVKNKENAYVGAILYTFSGFTFSTLFYNHFMDVIALFPFLLYSLDRCVQRDKKWCFAISVGILASTNYVFFVMEVVFLIVYFGCKVLSREYRITFKKFTRLAVESIVGFSLSGIIVVPSVIDLLGNPRATARFAGLKDMLIYTAQQYALLIKAAFLSSDLQNGASLYGNKYNSTELYLPMVGMIFVISYLIHCEKKRNFIFYLLLSCGIFSAIPVLNSCFQLFNVVYYTRWFFMFVIVLVLASIKAMDEKYEIISGSTISVIACLILMIYFFDEKVIKNGYFGWIMGITLLGILGTILIFIKWKLHNSYTVFGVLIVFVMAIGMGQVYNMFDYQGINGYFDEIANTANHQELPEEEFYRTENQSYYNTYMASNNHDIVCWNSTVSSSIFSFYNSVGVERGIRSMPDNNFYGLRSLLSVKYSYNVKNENLNYILVKNTDKELIYENLDYLPMGFCFDSYITEQDYYETLPEQRHLILLRALVLKNEDIETYSKNLKKLNVKKMKDLDHEGFLQDLADRRKYVCDEFQVEENGFHARINLPENKMIFFSVPYERGWKAYINGEETEIINVDEGLMAIRGNAGDNLIEFRYVPEGFKQGVLLSVSAVLILVGALLKKLYRESRKRWMIK